MRTYPGLYREPEPCPECEGAGYLERIIGEGRTSIGVVYPIVRAETCIVCDGTGAARCDHCNSRGQLRDAGVWVCRRHYVGEEG